MHRHRPLTLVALLVVSTALSMMAAADEPAAERTFTADFGLHRNDRLEPGGGNQYAFFRPGMFWRYEGEDDGEQVEVLVSVLPQTRRIKIQAQDGPLTVKTRIVEEREWINGALAQVSLNYYACCPKTGNVYYFGEKVKHFANGQFVDHEGTWIAGKSGAKPGLLMPGGNFLLGARYQQELAPGISMDRAEHARMGFTAEVPAGQFKNCVEVVETSPLDPDEETLKVYAPGVGLISDGDVHLVEYGVQ